MLKRIGVMLVIFLMAFSQVAFASGDLASKPELQRNNLKAEDLEPTIAPEEEVRAIVEVEGEAPIEKATEKGVKFGSLSVSEKKQFLNEAKAKKKGVKKAMKGKDVNAKPIQEFNAVMNGFSVEVQYKDFETIEKIPNVKEVTIANEYEQPIAEPDMVNSKKLVEAQQAWRDYGFKGEGMVVGVIDTGIDHEHQDMMLSGDTDVKLTEDDVNETIAEENLPGRYYTEKVPYGYNYMDENHEYTDDFPGASSHGTHVAGSVGANGDESNNGILGIAPEAQLLNLKVFGNDPESQSTYGDVYIKAIDDAIKLGADVLNMSLGSPAGFVNDKAPEQQAVTRAVDNGVLMSISAGNSNKFGEGFFYPYASNPDYGVTGSPGVADDSLQVASYENSLMKVDALEYTIDGETGTFGFLSASETDPPADGSSFGLVDAGLGYPEDYEGKDLEGKFALVQRGELSFVDKALNAQNAGAAGVLVYNNTDGMINMASDPTIEIPQLSLSKTDGEQLAEALANGDNPTVAFHGDKTSIVNPEAGKMSAFTSWGLTPNLDFKPEITAPGGQIYSTLNNGEYGIKSGTSMAAPHVSGGGALVLERIDQEFGYEGANRVNLAKKLMMNTSETVDFQGAPVSPRRQGTGVMQLHAALSTPVAVSNSDTGEAKVALREVTSNTVSFELTAENFTDEAVTYDVEANAQTDTPANGGGVLVTAPNQFPAQELDGAASVDNNTIEVPANGKTTFEVTINVSEFDKDLKSTFTNGYWLEGFVTLTDPTDTNPTLSVPYVGFKGEWDDAPIFDSADESSYYGMTGIATELSDGEYGFFEGEAVISPNGDDELDSALLVVSFLRNAKEVSFNVLDADGHVVETLTEEDYVRKNYYDGGLVPTYSLDPERTWDGTIEDEPAPDGQYFLQAEGVINFDGAEQQSIKLPITVDTAGPEVDANINRGQREVDLAVSDENGVAEWEVQVDRQDPIVMTEETELELDGIHPSQVVTITATDNAGNVTEDVVMGPQGKANGKFKGNNGNESNGKGPRN
ncbi:S8 family serine peptidase [Lentibacillus jeotgali]|uniref:S8 family serine peptidase n=1 Tax=Lentibacillus jeotgali TaxID=558169 RepID=UPI0002627C1B|nr:S8 family serine peptidase [Lentibacillus jeotgali]